MSDLKSKTRSEELVEAFTELGPVWVRWVNASLPSASVSFARMRLLSALQDGGEQRMSELAVCLEVTQRRITALVDALEEEELVQRRPHPTDGRSTLVSITPAGTEQQDVNWQQHQEEVAQAFAQLPAEQQQQLLEITPVLTEAMRRLTAERPATGAAACLTGEPTKDA
jgi:DNA-binding MarR family transcriptional regulator